MALTRGLEGQLNDLTLTYGEFTPVTLREAAALELSADRVKVGELCLLESAAAQFCGSGGWLRSGSIDLDARFRGIPISLVNLAEDTGFEFSQLLSGKIVWHQAEGRRPTGQAEVNIIARRHRESHAT